MPGHGRQRLGFGKTMGTGGKTMVKKTGTALKAMGRCRKLFWMFFFRWDLDILTMPASYQRETILRGSDGSSQRYGPRKKQLKGTPPPGGGGGSFWTFLGCYLRKCWSRLKAHNDKWYINGFYPLLNHDFHMEVVLKWGYPKSSIYIDFSV